MYQCDSSIDPFLRYRRQVVTVDCGSPEEQNEKNINDVKFEEYFWFIGFLRTSKSRLRNEMRKMLNVMIFFRLSFLRTNIG